jgi:hypothetical protein
LYHAVDINGTNTTAVYMTLDRLTAVNNPAIEPVQCFEGYHNVVVALAVIGICCLYPTAMLTRPMFQALDQNLKITFDYTYLFVFAQIQTVLLVASAFFPRETVLLLCLCLGSDLILVWYFWVKKPCTAPLLNTIALIAFGFSAWLNVASLIVVWVGDDSAPSIMMFCYVVCVFFLLIYGLQVVYFPLDEYKHLNKLEGPERMQLAISMRTEVALRLMNLLTDAEFWTDVVVKSQPAAWKKWSVSGLVVTAVFFLNCAHAGFSTIYFGGMHLLAWYASPSKSSWFDLLPKKLKFFFRAVGAEMRRRKRRRAKARAESTIAEANEHGGIEMTEFGLNDAAAECSPNDAAAEKADSSGCCAMDKAVVLCHWCTDFVCMAGDLICVVGEVMLKAEDIASKLENAKADAEAGEEEAEAEGDADGTEGEDSEDDEEDEDAEDDADDDEETTPLVNNTDEQAIVSSCSGRFGVWISVKRANARKWLKNQAAAAAHVRLATFILRSTVAMVVFDVVDIVITLVYDDEEEGPITKTAVLSMLFSAASAAYGLVGRKRDLKVRFHVSALPLFLLLTHATITNNRTIGLSLHITQAIKKQQQRGANAADDADEENQKKEAEVKAGEDEGDKDKGKTEQQSGSTPEEEGAV